MLIHSNFARDLLLLFSEDVAILLIRIEGIELPFFNSGLIFIVVQLLLIFLMSIYIKFELT
jgi:hypothetical protein